jgi:hypothetical protein
MGALGSGIISRNETSLVSEGYTREEGTILSKKCNDNLCRTRAK